MLAVCLGSVQFPPLRITVFLDRSEERGERRYCMIWVRSWLGANIYSVSGAEAGEPSPYSLRIGGPHKGKSEGPQHLTGGWGGSQFISSGKL